MLNLNFPCLFHLATGYYCPGCGGTRAIASLLHGQLFRSFLYHPVILYTAFLLLRGLVFSILEFAKSGRFSLDLERQTQKIRHFLAHLPHDGPFPDPQRLKSLFRPGPSGADIKNPLPSLQKNKEQGIMSA